jgi:hypothetical protein
VCGQFTGLEDFTLRNKRRIFIATLLASWFVLRRQGKRWGATDEEFYKALPGDEIIPHPMLETTHAVTVHAPPEQIWPWLVQMGFGRAEWYMEGPWHRLEKLFWRLTVREDAKELRAPVTSPHHIIPELQQLAVDDIIPDGPPGSAFFTVKRLDPNRLLALYSDSHLRFLTPAAVQQRYPALASYGEFTWNFLLEPHDQTSTRLILRMRANVGPPFLQLAMPLVYLVDVMNARLMFKGVKKRVETMGWGGGANEKRPSGR